MSRASRCRRGSARAARACAPRSSARHAVVSSGWSWTRITIEVRPGVARQRRLGGDEPASGRRPARGRVARDVRAAAVGERRQRASSRSSRTSAAANASGRRRRRGRVAGARRPCPRRRRRRHDGQAGRERLADLALHAGAEAERRDRDAVAREVRLHLRHLADDLDAGPASASTSVGGGSRRPSARVRAPRPARAAAPRRRASRRRRGSAGGGSCRRRGGPCGRPAGRARRSVVDVRDHVDARRGARRAARSRRAR